MASSLLTLRFRFDHDIMLVRKLLGWQSVAYDGRVQCGIISLTDLACREIVLFSSYALGGFALPASSFFLALLENYGLQLHHLTSHVIALVVIFAHFCEM
jgi:hypothetical protein